ncbi:unnamed protein product [Rotaria sp. Silwood1]|nr:unnamed protein product [Rotaria sp. Silwood1]
MKENIVDRIKGSMFGLAVGDALGARVEFRPHSYMTANPVKDLEGGGTWGLQRGQFTDDTSMALCLAISLIACQDFVPYDQLVRYKWWYRHGYMSSTAALNGEKKEELTSKTFYDKHLEWFGYRSLHPDVMTIAQGSYQKARGYQDGIRGKGYIINAMEAALWAFWSDEDSFEKGALNAVNLGDDTDTTAAIYGQLAGAYYGYKKLPKRCLSGGMRDDLVPPTKASDTYPVKPPTKSMINIALTSDRVNLP